MSTEKKMGSIRSGFGRAMEELGEKDKKVLALCADLTDSLKLSSFKENYPERFYEMGISEQNMMSAAAGMAHGGATPFVCSYAVFNPGRNWDQLRVSVCYSKKNVKVVGGHAGLTTGPDGATHQALEDLAITRVLPHMTVLVPCDEEEAYKATLAAAKHLGPVYLRLSREKSEMITSKKSSFEIGKAQVLRKGKDVTLVACGLGVQFALQAAEDLFKEGIDVTVINCSTIKPLDKKTLLSEVKKTSLVVSVEEHQITGGLGSALAELFAQEFPVRQAFVGVKDSFGESGEGYELLEKYGISKKHIVDAVKLLLKKKDYS